MSHLKKKKSSQDTEQVNKWLLAGAQNCKKKKKIPAVTSLMAVLADSSLACQDCFSTCPLKHHYLPQRSPETLQSGRVPQVNQAILLDKKVMQTGKPSGVLMKMHQEGGVCQTGK